MRTPPTKFSNFQKRGDVDRVWVVKITDGSNTLMVADRDMELTDGHVYALLKGDITIEQSIDPLARSWSDASFEVILRNSPYRKDTSGNWVRPSDETVFDGSQVDVTIYAITGPSAAALTDGLLEFTGVSTAPCQYNGSELTLSVEDIGAQKRREQFPITSMSEVDSGHPEEDAILPVIGGSFEDATLWGGPEHLVRGYARESGGTITYHIADHLLADVHAAWVRIDELDAWMKLDWSGMSFTETTGSGDDGITRTIVTVATSSNPIKGHLFIPPRRVEIEAFTGAYNNADYSGGRNNCQNPQYMYDLNNKTCSILNQGSTAGHALVSVRWEDVESFQIVPGGTATYESRRGNSGCTPFRSQRGPHGPDQEREIIRGTYTLPAIKKSRLTMHGTDTYLVWRALANPDLTYSYGWSGSPDYDFLSCAMGWFPNAPGGAQYLMSEESNIYDGSIREMHLWADVPSGAAVEVQFSRDVGWDFYTNGFIARFLVKTSAATEDWMLKIYQVALRLYTTTDINISEGIPVYFEVSGIPVSSRQGTAYASVTAGDVAEHPLLQSELLQSQPIGLSAGEIDTDSVDAAYTASISENTVTTDLETRFIIRSEDRHTIGSFLQELAENSHHLFYFDADGEARFVDMLYGDTPSPDATIPYYDLSTAPEVFGTDFKSIINRLGMNYGFVPVRNRFSESMIIDNSSSQSTYGIKTRPGDFRFIVGDTTATNIGKGLVSESYSLLKNVKHGIRIATRGWTWLHLQIGDWIEIDDSSVDPHLEFRSATWSGEVFMIIGKQRRMGGVVFEALKIYE